MAPLCDIWVSQVTGFQRQTENRRNILFVWRNKCVFVMVTRCSVIREPSGVHWGWDTSINPWGWDISINPLRMSRTFMLWIPCAWHQGHTLRCKYYSIASESTLCCGTTSNSVSLVTSNSVSLVTSNSVSLVTPTPQVHMEEESGGGGHMGVACPFTALVQLVGTVHLASPCTYQKLQWLDEILAYSPWFAYFMSEVSRLLLDWTRYLCGRYNTCVVLPGAWTSE